MQTSQQGSQMGSLQQNNNPYPMQQNSWPQAQMPQQWNYINPIANQQNMQMQNGARLPLFQQVVNDQMTPQQMNNAGGNPMQTQQESSQMGHYNLQQDNYMMQNNYAPWQPGPMPQSNQVENQEGAQNNGNGIFLMPQAAPFMDNGNYMMPQDNGNMMPQPGPHADTPPQTFYGDHNGALVAQELGGSSLDTPTMPLPSRSATSSMAVQTEEQDSANHTGSVEQVLGTSSTSSEQPGCTTTTQEQDGHDDSNNGDNVHQQQVASNDRESTSSSPGAVQLQQLSGANSQRQRTIRGSVVGARVSAIEQRNTTTVVVPTRAP